MYSGIENSQEESHSEEDKNRKTLETFFYKMEESLKGAIKESEVNHVKDVKSRFYFSVFKRDGTKT